MNHIAERVRATTFVVTRILVLACIVALLVWRSLLGGPGVGAPLAIGLCGVVAFTLLMVARYIPGDRLRSDMTRKFPTAVVVTCRMNSELSKDTRWLDAVGQEVWASNSFPLSVCMVADVDGISFWLSHESVPVCVGQIVWNEVATVEGSSKILRHERFATLYVELVGGFHMNVLLGSPAVFGMWPAKRVYIERAAGRFRALKQGAENGMSPD